MTWKDMLPPIEAIEFNAWPEQVTLDDYARASKEVVRLIRKLSKTASIYGFGKVGAPGFSDLDFAVVLEDSGPSIDLERWEALKRTLSPRTNYTLLHKPFFFGHSLWHDFAASNNFSNIQHLAGPVLAPVPPPNRSTAILRLITSVEEGVLSPYRGLIQPILERRVHVRPHLNTLSRLRHKANVLEEFGCTNPAWTQCAEDIGELRQAWFSFKEAEQIRAVYDLTVRCIEIESEMIEERAKLIVALGIAIPEISQPEKEVVGVFNDSVAFVERFEGERSQEFIVRSHEIAASLFYVLPAAFMVPFLVYISRGSQVWRHFKDRMAVFARVPDLEGRAFPAELYDRLRMLDDYLRFLDERKVHSGMLFDRIRERQAGVEPSREFWDRAQPYIMRPEDIVPFGLRRRLAEVQAHTLAIMESETGRVASFIRELQEKVLPRNSFFDRLCRWLIRAISDLRRRPEQPDKQLAVEP
jgi:hypothetical protein